MTRQQKKVLRKCQTCPTLKKRKKNTQYKSNKKQKKQSMNNTCNRNRIPFHTEGARFLVTHYDAYKNMTISVPLMNTYRQYLHQFRQHVKQYGNATRDTAASIPTKEERKQYKQQEHQHTNDPDIFETNWRFNEVVRGYIEILENIKSATCASFFCKEILHHNEQHYCATCQKKIDRERAAKLAYFKQFQQDLDDFKSTFYPGSRGCSSSSSSQCSSITFGEQLTESPLVAFLKRGRVNGKYLAMRKDGSFIDLTMPNKDLQQRLTTEEFDAVNEKTLESQYRKKLSEKKDNTYMLLPGFTLNRKRHPDKYFTMYEEGKERRREFERCLMNGALNDMIVDVGQVHALTWQDNHDNWNNVVHPEVHDDLDAAIHEYDKLHDGGGFELREERTVADNGVFKIVQTHRQRGKTWALCRKKEQTFTGVDTERVVNEKASPTNNGRNRFKFELIAYDKDRARKRFQPFIFIGKRHGEGNYPSSWTFDDVDEFRWVPCVRRDGAERCK